MIHVTRALLRKWIEALLLAALAYVLALPALVAGRTHIRLRTFKVAPPESH